MKIKNLILMVTCLILSSKVYADTNSEIQQYKSEGKVIMDMIISKKIDAKKVEQSALKMADTAASIAKKYAKKFPQGKKLLEITITELPKIKKASFEEIEKQWHDLAYFSGKDIGLDISDEDNEHFTDPLHCIVHPLLTMRASEMYLKSKDDKHIQTMKEELFEGLEQMDNVSSKLK